MLRRTMNNFCCMGYYSISNSSWYCRGGMSIFGSPRRCLPRERNEPVVRCYTNIFLFENLGLWRQRTLRFPAVQPPSSKPSVGSVTLNRGDCAYAGLTVARGSRLRSTFCFLRFYETRMTRKPHRYTHTKAGLKPTSVWKLPLENCLRFGMPHCCCAPGLML